MNKNKIINLKVGVTVIVSVVVLLYGIAFLKDFRIDIQTNDLVIYFSDVNGLKEGDQVSVNGVPKGKVSKIELAGDSVMVIFTLSKDVVLKKDYTISVAMIELMSGKQLYIKPGVGPEPADMTKPLVGEKSSDIVTLIGTMNKIGGDVKVISENLTRTVEKLNEAIDNINEIAGDEGLKSNIRSTAGNFSTASRNLSLLLQENRQNLTSLTSKLNTIADDLGGTVSETGPEIKETIGDIRELTSKLDSLTGNLNEIVVNSRDSNSTVGKLLYDDAFYTNLNSTVLSINKLIKKIDKDGIRLKLF
jgi:phospholipid/cholesterol/gamma-HCH transport system substrate-binding protein